MKFTKYIYLAGLAILFSCGKDNDDPGPEGPQGPQGPNGLKSLLDVKPLLAGEKCANGGLTIQSGIDKNNNNKLEENEIENTQYVCNGNNALSDKQIIVNLGLFATPIDQQASIGYYLGMPRFNINNYPGVDSIVVIAAPYSQYAPGGTAILELINYTDKTVIENSAITSDVSYNTQYRHFISKNCYSGFPKKEFDLGYKLSATLPGNQPRVYGNIVMILYRK